MADLDFTPMSLRVPEVMPLKPQSESPTYSCWAFATEYVHIYYPNVESRPLHGNESEEFIEQGDIPIGEDYEVLKPIPVKVIGIGGLDFTASFDEANIAIGGETFRDAFHALIFELLDVFDYLSRNRANLGPDTQYQLDILSRHLVKINR